MAPLAKRLGKRYANIFQHPADRRASGDDGLRVHLDGGRAPVSDTFDKLRVAVGRQPNGRLSSAEQPGVSVDQRSFIPADKHMPTNVPLIFASVM